jgi:hypothetical protein
MYKGIMPENPFLSREYRQRCSASTKRNLDVTMTYVELELRKGFLTDPRTPFLLPSNVKEMEKYQCGRMEEEIMTDFQFKALMAMVLEIMDRSRDLADARKAIAKLAGDSGTRECRMKAF